MNRLHKMPVQYRFPLLCVVCLCLVLPIRSLGQTSEPRLPESAAVELGYEYRQKGMRALGDGIHGAAARFFAAYREQIGTREPDFTDATILLIRARLAAGDAAAARQALDHYDERSPGTDDSFYKRNLLFWRAAVLVAEGDAAGGLEMVEPLLAESQYPELRERALLLVAEGLVELARWDEAAAKLRAFLEDFPDSEQTQRVLLNLTRVAVATEQFEQAEKWLSQARGEREEDPIPVALHRLLLETTRGDVAAAMEIHAAIADKAPLRYQPAWWATFSQLARKLTALEAREEALKVLPQALPLAPGSEQRAEMLLLQADSQIGLGRKEAALTTLQAFLRMSPEPEKAIATRFRMAGLQAETGDLAAAIETYAGLSEDRDADLETRYHSAVEQGRLLVETEALQEALQVFVKAGEMAVDDHLRATALLLAGDVAMSLEDYETAATSYRYVADELQAPENAATARFRQAKARIRQGRHDTAAAIFERFVEQYPDDDRAVAAWLGRAAALRDAGRPAASIDAFEKFVAGHPSHAEAPGALMEVYKLARHSGDMERSMRVLNRICLEYADSDFHTQALYHRVYVAFQVGDYDLAVTEGERFVKDFERLPNAADVLLWLADYHAGRGDWARAESRYRQVFILFPDSSQAQTALYEAANAAFAQDGGEDRALRLLAQLEEKVGSGQALNSAIMGRAAFLQGDVLAELMRYEEAAEWFETARQRLTRPELRLAAGGRMADMHFALASQESFRRAAALYGEMLEGDPSPALRENLLYRLAKTLEELGEREKALDRYLEIVFAYDMDTKAGRVRDWYYFARAGYAAARLLVEQGQMDGAARIYERIHQSGIPTADEARERAREIRQAHRLDE